MISSCRVVLFHTVELTDKENNMWLAGNETGRLIYNRWTETTGHRKLVWHKHTQCDPEQILVRDFVYAVVICTDNMTIYDGYIIGKTKYVPING